MRFPDSSPKWPFHTADALVLWPERAGAGRIRLDDAWNRRFVKRLSTALPKVAREDAEAAIKVFDLEKHPTFCEWMDRLAGGLDLGPQREAHGVVTPTRAWRAWLYAGTRFDLDCILCYKLAKEGVGPGEYDGCSWGAVCELWSHELELILSRGVADMHVHYTGFRRPNLMWLRSVTGMLERDALRNFYKALDETPADKALLARVLDGADPDARAIRQRIMLRLDDAEGPKALLSAERRTLIEAWGDVIRGDPKRAPPADDPKRDVGLRALDLYFNAKSAFLSVIAQPSHNVIPGLQAFRRHLDAARIGAPRENARSRAMREARDNLAIARQDRHVRRIELRIAPAAEVRDYEASLRAIEEAEKEALENKESLSFKARYCVHFMRSWDRYASWRDFHTDLSRAAGRLHAYRQALTATPEGHARLDYIRRIDVAGVERSNPPENFAFVFRLLRGNIAAWNMIRERSGDEEIYSLWCGLAEGASPPRLSASCHAGEDYFHPLDGVVAIDTAIDGLELADGDSVGHGLALGAFSESGAPLTGEACLAPAGRQFDVLLWLHRFASRFEAPAGELAAIDDALTAFGEAIDVRRPPGGWPQLHGLLEHQQGPVLAKRPVGDFAKLAFYRQYASEKIAEKRMAPLDACPVFDSLPTVAARARRAVAEKAAKRGVLIELNPSSNLRICGGADRFLSGNVAELRRWPLINLVRDFANQLRFTINTDDPGIFGTTIGSEYALLFECLMLDNWTRSEAGDFLERCRVASIEGVR